MSKESRITIRTPAELDAWLADEAEANGLDKAAFARMLLFRAMNGQAELEAKALHPRARVTAPPVDQTSVDIVNVQPDEAEAANVDIDDLVARRLAEAQASGRLSERAEVVEEIDPALAELGMRPFRLAPPPSFGEKSGRIQRSSSWAPNGAR